MCSSTRKSRDTLIQSVSYHRGSRRCRGASRHARSARTQGPAGGARASERRADTEHAIAKLNFDRLVGVNKSQPNLVAQQDLDDAQAKDSAAEAALANAKADADRYSSLEDYTRVTAPFAGVITKRFVDNGSLVEAGTSSNTDPIVELAENDLLRLPLPGTRRPRPLWSEQAASCRSSSVPSTALSLERLRATPGPSTGRRAP